MNHLDYLIPVALVAVLIVAIALGTRTARRNREYDERQALLRAKGYKLGYTVTILLEVLALFLVEFGVIPLPCATLAIWTGLLAGIITFAVYCIMKDAFFAINEKGTYYMVLCAVIVLADGATAVSRFVDGSILENGLPTFSSCNALMMAVCFLAVLIALLLRKYAGEGDE